MRRKEFEVPIEEDCEPFLRERHDGVLTFTGEDGWPKAVPLNYAYLDGSAYFHGSKHGEKMKGIAADPRAEFVVYESHAFIPSYFSDPYLACPATVFFRSVRMRGRIEQVEDPGEKAKALGALLRSMQPEGGHAPIDAEDPKYVASLKGVAVMRLDIEEMSGKFKFGQHLPDRRLKQVLDGLTERNLPGDPRTIEEMIARHPSSKRQEE
ncbi:pyridoxamine 5'-phosphate oxidase family protein [Cohnella sp. AR92]|uniref:pyridoxamine 5'-phosphate oxidase family protein n=1 Tax=Cohnella sp. AR92 TaxID=648716 RepID=UPI000F8D46E5|nr:pyridoxamine 5'-phosphate oxidase family protein [Cohnella sp. AR92]RUS44657.1 flavin-nucleotide-binding protein [Cohnella sp. AR92]